MTRYVNSRVVLDHRAIDVIKDAAVTALEMTGDKVLDDVIDKNVVPMAVGTLQESAYVNREQSSKGHVHIAFNTPYARRLYFHPEYNFRTDNNENAKGEWLEDWTEKGKYAKKVKQYYAEFLKQLGGL